MALQVLHVLCGVAEYDELPVRHNEDKINTTLAGEVRWPTDSRSADDPHTKANLLLQVSDMYRMYSSVAKGFAHCSKRYSQLRVLQYVSFLHASKYLNCVSNGVDCGKVQLSKGHVFRLSAIACHALFILLVFKCAKCQCKGTTGQQNYIYYILLFHVSHQLIKQVVK